MDQDAPKKMADKYGPLAQYQIAIVYYNKANAGDKTKWEDMVKAFEFTGRTEGLFEEPTEVRSGLSRPCSAATAARSTRASTAGVARTATSPEPTEAAVASSATVSSAVPSSPGAKPAASGSDPGARSDPGDSSDPTPIRY